MKKEKNIILDFDSTIVQHETIEVLAEFSLQNNTKKNDILSEIKNMTSLAMSGKISFSEALSKRVSLLEAHKKHINKTIEFLRKNISLTFKENLSFFNEINNNCFIISGGFKEIIIPVLENFNLHDNNIYANSFIYDDQYIISIDKNNPLSKDGGKNLVAQNIKGCNIIIGDGYTDYEVKKDGNADIFIQYTENVNRPHLNKNADYICSDFSQIIKILRNV